MLSIAEQGYFYVGGSWTDRWEVQNCELVDLSDLATETAYVRGKLTAYLNDLISRMPHADVHRFDLARVAAHEVTLHPLGGTIDNDVTVAVTRQ